MISGPIAKTGRSGRGLAGAITFSALLMLAGCQNPMEDSNPAPAGPDLAVSKSSARTYYVSPSGNDGRSGTSPSTAWRTLSKVSSRTYVAGDQILLQGGATFSGKVYLDGRSKGSASNPITIASYGSGRAVINGGKSDAIMVYNTGGVVIKNLVLTSSGRTTNTGNGINAFTDLPSGTKVDYLRIDNVDAANFGKYGVSIGSWRGTTGFKNVSVTNVSAHDNTLGGIGAYAQSPYSHQNVYIGHVQAYDNTGRSGISSPSGSGIVLSGVSGGTIERSVSHDNGRLSDAPGGPVGIWTYNSEKILIQYNESYSNRTAKADGGGFDFDQNTRYSTMQYNYSHDNAGAGLLMAHSPNNSNHTGNVIRYNISEDDARTHSSGAITVYGKTSNAEIYNNTVYLSPAPSGTPRAIFIHNYTITYNVAKNVHVRNNTFYTTGGLKLVEVSPGELVGSPGLRFEGNDYYTTGGTTRFLWGSSTYTSVAAWAGATSQEKVSGVLRGMAVNPGLTAAGQGGTIGDADRLATLSAYKLASGSALINKGLNLRSQFGVSVPSTDFYSGATPNGSYDVGAHEWR